MNTVNAIVTGIHKTDVVTYIHVQSGTTEMKLIKYRCPGWVGVGDEVYCTFQEASVCVSKECPGKVSIENRLPATLKAVRTSDSLCELTFESDIGDVVSLITAEAYEELGLESGCEATMLLRGVDMQLKPKLTPMDLGTLKRKRTKIANE